MLLGFFSALPGIIRLAQCVRRYLVNGLWTHVLNGTKYSFTILQYTSLSLWRIYGGDHFLAFFIVSATLNGLFCSFWDLNYDWSMPAFDPTAKPHPFLREVLAFHKQTWMYYIAMILDPILRFNWIFYVVFRGDTQHSSLVSFLIALSEVIRRGIWVLFRVENEHCTNVSRSKAFRDPSLPYSTRVPQSQAHDTTTTLGGDGTAARSGGVEAASPTEQQQREEDESPIFAALRRVGSTFRTAHAMDYVRKQPNEESEVRKDEEDDTDSE